MPKFRVDINQGEWVRDIDARTTTDALDEAKKDPTYPKQVDDVSIKKMPSAPVPNQLIVDFAENHPHLQQAINILEDEHEKMLAGTYHEDNDNSEYLFEVFAQAVYGEDIFKWRNKHSG